MELFHSLFKVVFYNKFPISNLYKNVEIIINQGCSTNRCLVIDNTDPFDEILDDILGLFWFIFINGSLNFIFQYSGMIISRNSKNKSNIFIYTYEHCRSSNFCKRF